MRLLLLLAPLLGLGCTSGCAIDDDDLATVDQDQGADPAVCVLEGGGYAGAIDNPWLPLPVGQVTVLEGGGEKVQVTVLDETETVSGVVTRVVEEREWEGDELVEVSRNFFAQTLGGTLCYFGEDVDEYSGGQVVAHGGAWRAGVDGATAGILMPALPAVGQVFAEENAPGVAQDTAEITAMGESVTVPAGTFTDTLRVVESSPLDAGTSLKVYGRGLGMIVDDGIELTQSP